MITVEVPGVGTVEFPDGTSPQIMEQALAQFMSDQQPAMPEKPWSQMTDAEKYGPVPEGYVLNPATGQMEDLRSPINPNIPTGSANAFMIGAGQGLGFGGFDETVAAGRSILGNSGYDYELARMREAERRAQENNPAAYYSGMIPGGVASSVAGWGAAGVSPTGANLAQTALRGAGMGAVEGGVYGFLSGEGSNRVGDAARGAGIGAAVGAAAPPVVAAGAAGVRAAGDLVGGGLDSMLGRASARRANRFLSDVLKKSGMSVDDIADDVARAAQIGQPEYRLMDATGLAGQRGASGIVRAGGDGAEEIAAFLRQRQLDQADRVAGFVDEAFGLNGKTAAKIADDLTSARDSLAAVEYGAARAQAAPVDVTGVLGVLDDRLGQLKGSGIVGDGIDATFQKFRDRLAAEVPPAGTTASELTDFSRVLGVKRDVDDAIEVAKRAGERNKVRELMGVKSALDQALEGSSLAYRAANDNFRAGSALVDAVQEGAGMAKTGTRAADNISAFSAMTPGQQESARAGYGDRLIAQIEANKAETANKVRPFASSKIRDEAAAMSVDPNLLAERVSRENSMWAVMNRALGGSRTADNLQDVEATGLLADAGRIARDALTGRIGNALSTVAARAGSALTGKNEATRKLIAEALMSADPRKTLAPAIAQQARSDATRRLVETLLRAGGREYLPR